MFPYQFLSITTTLKIKSTSDVPSQMSKIFKIHGKTYIIVWSQQCPLTMWREKPNSHNEDRKIVFNKRNQRPNSIILTITFMIQRELVKERPLQHNYMPPIIRNISSHKTTLTTLNYPWSERKNVNKEDVSQQSRSTTDWNATPRRWCLGHAVECCKRKKN